jgi:(1->4)-alpha-D-glucan 1-alpha-D-glucosylmutase
MPEDAVLNRLAAALGIATQWRDVWGHEHAVPAATLRALLRVMGYAAEDDGSAAARLQEWERRRWGQILPPVAVTREGAAPGLALLRLPRSAAQQRCVLHLACEDGGHTRSDVLPAELAVVESANVDGSPCDARHLPLPAAPRGYHRLRLERDGRELAQLVLIVAPQRCYLPDALFDDGRAWGPAVQLYAVRSQRNWGIGDFTDLRHLCEQWGTHGASLVGINPLHAPLPHQSSRANPYDSSSRTFLNPLYIDPEASADFSECEAARRLVASAAFQRRLQALRETALVDYAGVAELKLTVLQQLHSHFRAVHLSRDTARAAAFRAFRDAHGRALRLHAIFQALQEQLQASDPHLWGWPAWPAELRDPDSPAVARLAGECRERVEFHEYLQWQAELQLEAAGRVAMRQHLGVGLYGDLAVGMNPGGADAWAQQPCLASGVKLGAPPDAFNPAGQDWGLPPYDPHRLRAAAYAPFIAVLRASMRHFGALRIDHVMALTRLYWIPPGADPNAGAYVSYPLDELLAIVALESQRNACMVVGEDLGTVPDALRQSLAAAGVLGYRLLYFETRRDGSCVPPEDYPAQSLAAVSTHDLPTLAGFWAGSDLIARDALQLFPSQELRDQQVVARAQARAQLLLALEREQLLPAGVTVNPVSVPAMTPALANALHRYLARSPAKLLTVQVEDMLGASDQINIPGTTEELHPNWRRKLTLDLETYAADARFIQLCDALNAERPHRLALPDAPPRAAPRVLVVPRCTYRLQLHADFRLPDATALIPYLAALGVSHVYCSPYLRARAGSRHGYDVTDHNTLNPEIGTAEDLQRFVAALCAHGMGQIIDVVPNHVGIMGRSNNWWMDVLESGPASIYAGFFDIDWQPANAALVGKVLVPVLSEPYGTALERGELQLRFEPERGAFAVFYHRHRFPLDPREYPPLLRAALRLAAGTQLSDPQRAEFESLITAFGHLPPRHETSPEKIAERQRDKELHKQRLGGLYAQVPALAQGIDAAVRTFAGAVGSAGSFDALHELLEAQAFRLAYWRVASDEINYRRFFDINDLASLCMENAAVFEATHRTILGWIAAGWVDGLRIDHPDGLFDPAGYFRRLQERSGGIYIVAEKILADYERLPENWPIQGTTGYDFARLVGGLCIDGGGVRRLERAYRSFVQAEVDYEEQLYEAKKLVLRVALAAELSVLANQLARIARADRHTRDFTLNNLRLALTEVVACFPVYRTYIVQSPAAEDRRYIEWAIGRARTRSTASDLSIFEFIRGILLCEHPGATDTTAALVNTFARRFQQVTAPVAAKGTEDTAFYRHTSLLSLNEVGSDPRSAGVSVRAFHAENAVRARLWPHSMLATSTHDTKRSEDVRARIDVLSEIPAAWRKSIGRWSTQNRSRKQRILGRTVPSRGEEYLFYQTLIGSWPSPEPDDATLAQYRERIQQYMRKALREAKLHSSWLNPDEDYEQAVADFVARALTRAPTNAFLADFCASHGRLAFLGMLNSLTQLLCKLTAPGVPDIYQGNELWDYSLVDPDNRRPVDFVQRRRLLAQVQAIGVLEPAARQRAIRDLLESWSDGRVKLYVTCRTLELRRRSAALFRDGRYQPLAVRGDCAEHLCAYARVLDGTEALVVVPRLPARLLGDRAGPPLGEPIWSNTTVLLPSGPDATIYRNVFDGADVAINATAEGRELTVAHALAHFPVALLHQGPR